MKTKIKILIPGGTGFIGYHLVKKLIRKRIYVTGVDSLNNYYYLKLKKDRLKDINKCASFVRVNRQVNNFYK